jgi:hypothetical protein
VHEQCCLKPARFLAGPWPAFVAASLAAHAASTQHAQIRPTALQSAIITQWGQLWELSCCSDCRRSAGTARILHPSRLWQHVGSLIRVWNRAICAKSVAAAHRQEEEGARHHRHLGHPPRVPHHSLVSAAGQPRTPSKTCFPRLVAYQAVLCFTASPNQERHVLLDRLSGRTRASWAQGGRGSHRGGRAAGVWAAVGQPPLSSTPRSAPHHAAPCPLQVHALLERCIQRGMSKTEAAALLARLGVAPKFTLLGARGRRRPFPAAQRARPYPSLFGLLSRAPAPVFRLLQYGSAWRQRTPSSLRPTPSSSRRR